MPSLNGVGKEKLIRLVKAAGCEIINRAEDLVGDVDRLTDLDIWVRFDVQSIPVIEVTKRHQSQEMLRVMLEEEK